MAIVVRDRNRRFFKGKSDRKFHNEKVRMGGHVFDSVKESKRFLELRLMERSGLIKNLQVHPVFEIVVNGQKVCSYVGDFQYLVPARKVVPEGEVVSYVQENGNLFERIVEDTKGIDKDSSWDTRTPVYRLKVKLLKALRGIQVREI